MRSQSSICNLHLNGTELSFDTNDRGSFQILSDIITSLDMMSEGYLRVHTIDVGYQKGTFFTLCLSTNGDGIVHYSLTANTMHGSISAAEGSIINAAEFAEYCRSMLENIICG